MEVDHFQPTPTPTAHLAKKHKDVFSISGHGGGSAPASDGCPATSAQSMKEVMCCSSHLKRLH
jgi:hypothetical protein